MYELDDLTDLTRAAVFRATRTAGWVRSPVTVDPEPSPRWFGTWSSPGQPARLIASVPRDRIDASVVAEVELTGARGTRRAWTVAGQCPVRILRDLLLAASQAPCPAPDPPSLLVGDWWREVGLSRPPGRLYEERWLQWDFPDPRGTLSELAWVIAGGDRPDISPGWVLVSTPGYVLSADLATPRHIVNAMVTGLNDDADFFAPQ